jgi:hypothetical protein
VKLFIETPALSEGIQNIFSDRVGGAHFLSSGIYKHRILKKIGAIVQLINTVTLREVAVLTMKIMTDYFKII